MSHTGIAGLTLYGGVGRLMRKYGLTVDNILAFDVVTADGQALHVDADNHPDLFWALRGGGPTFAIVTHFHYRLHPVGPDRLRRLPRAGRSRRPRQVFLAQHEHLAAAPDDFQVQYIFVHGPQRGVHPAGAPWRAGA